MSLTICVVNRLSRASARARVTMDSHAPAAITAPRLAQGPCAAPSTFRCVPHQQAMRNATDAVRTPNSMFLRHFGLVSAVKAPAAQNSLLRFSSNDRCLLPQLTSPLLRFHQRNLPVFTEMVELCRNLPRVSPFGTRAAFRNSGERPEPKEPSNEVGYDGHPGSSDLCNALID